MFAIKRSPYLGGGDYMKLTGIFGTRKTVPKERGAGGRFSKVPIINGPGKLSPLTLKIEVLIVLHLT